MIQKILIANRGEIACRIIRTCKKLNIRTVAIYTDIDHDSQHVLQADEAYSLDVAEPTQAYLNQEKIIDIAKKSKTDAIHPGYGFLAENVTFAKRCQTNNIIFIGPSAESIQLMGSKSTSKEALKNTNVPLIPGYHGTKQETNWLAQQAEKIGYPIMIKAADGGGGKGMRIVNNTNDFTAALEAAKREALNAFGSDEVILEKFIQQPRHIEIQILGDQHGNIVHLGERDCSVQRRHQKIIEETPSPFIDNALRKKMGNAAISAAKAVNYYGAGTVEFIVDNNNNFYFIEMNTRLQVEHPITEMVTGIDLVAWQIFIASNQQLDFKQDEITQNGYALEARIYAEDPMNDFLPASGKITYLSWPNSSEIRIDSGVTKGDHVSIYYDPMIAKIIMHGSSRQDTCQKMIDALANTHIIGIKNNLNFLQTLIASEQFKQANIDTNYLDNNIEQFIKNNEPTDIFLLLIASYFLLKQTHSTINTAWQTKDSWRIGGNEKLELVLKHTILNKEYLFDVINTINNYEIKINGQSHQIKSIKLIDDNQIKIETNEQQFLAYVANIDNHYYLNYQGHHHTFSAVNKQHNYIENNSIDQTVIAPMPGKIVSIPVTYESLVTKDDTVMIIEAMKMELSLKAPITGIVKKINGKTGEFVEADSILMELEKLKN